MKINGRGKYYDDGRGNRTDEDGIRQGIIVMMEEGR